MPANRLSKEKSPYLLQHAQNPVDWYPWGEEAFTRAKNEDKPVFLSIGYSTCHWCHVMERESFENPEIAKILNDHFVAVKVDREERPDIDSNYMSVVMALTGSGGWPLTVFLVPDKKPFYGGTYFPPEAKWGAPGLKDLLLTINDVWRNRREEVLQSSQSITDIFRQPKESDAGQSIRLGKDILEKAYYQFAQSFDAAYGGFGQQPKFPSGHNLSFLLRYWKRTRDAEALSMVEKTLSEMAKGGIYDQLGGGFHRYATDQKWHIPHFEKMLYDQALLATAYLEAYQATGKLEYANVAREIFEYVLRDMRDRQGGFFSAEDADSVAPEDLKDASKGVVLEKKEGAFYVWRSDEILEILGSDEGKIYNYHFGVQADGNTAYDPHGEFTGKNILYVAHTIEETANHFKMPAGTIEAALKKSKEGLFKARAARPRPHLDDKVLVDWNGLMISSLAFGSQVLKEPRYLKAAEEAAQFILKNLVRKDGRLLHRYRDGDSAIPATLDDYAFFIHGLWALYEAIFDVAYLVEAKRLTDEMMRLFWDTEAAGFFLTASDGEEILFKQKEIHDGAVPSGNSIAVLHMVRLGRLTLEEKYEEAALKLFEAFAGEVSQRPSAYAELLSALDFILGPTKEIVIAGARTDPATQKMFENVYRYFIPNKVVIYRPASDKEAQKLIQLVPFVKEQVPIKGKPTVYVCENHVCKLPTGDIKEFEKLLNDI